MRQILRGYASLGREALGLPNDGAFLSPPGSLILALAICGVFGLIRNAIAVGLGAPYGFYSFEPDIQFTMGAFPIHLFLFPAALLHGLLRLLGYRNVNADALFGLGFHLQVLHLIIPFIDWIGFGLGLPPAYVLGTHSIANAWYTNMLFMTPGIITAWLITAYVTARVLRKQLGIGWWRIVPASLATFLVVLIPTYIVFPTFNTLFNTSFGPYLWSPFKYMFDDPRWFPFWGYGTYFALTAAVGLIYWTKNSGRQDVRNFLEVNTAGRAHGWLVLLGTSRYLLDRVWSPDVRAFSWPFAWLNYVIYGYMLYLAIPAVAAFLMEKVFSMPVDKAGLLRESVLVWIVYPMVPIISMLTRSAPLRTIEWFRYIPTFMVGNNFLPLGMVAVIPVLIWFYTRALIRHSAARMPRSLVSILVALWLIYLAYYQYADNALFYVLGLYGTAVATGIYTLLFLAPLFLTAGMFHVAFGHQRIMLPQIVWGAAFINVILIAVGLISWSAGQ